MPANGYANIPAYPEFKGSYMYISTTSNKQGSFTIEQLPLYPGALVFDGVDDYSVCDNFPILTKEKGYTVVALRQWITYNPNAISAIATNASDRSFNGAFTFENYNKGAEQTISYGATQISLQYSKSPFSWQTTSKYNGVNIANGNKDATNSLVLGRSYPQRNDFANFAIWELVFLDHDATEEELTKIKDYFVKTYPWLFPDQAWTVVGKTNEDEDRATIANITGNGNDLVLSNFGFAEGSGYGLYAVNFLDSIWVKNTGLTKISPSSFTIENTIESTQATVYINTSGKDVILPSFKVNITGLGNVVWKYHYIDDAGDRQSIILQDGVNVLPTSYVSLSATSTWVGFGTITGVTDNITIEQIPEYEGYLVTDGVDDKITSSIFGMGKDFTIVGDWKFMDNIITKAGIVKSSSLFVYNTNNGLRIFINNTTKGPVLNTRTSKAICSDGRVYSDDWSEMLVNEEQPVTNSKSGLLIGINGNNFAKIALKNLAIYNQILSKDDCIKAYNYLQTLKAK